MLPKFITLIIDFCFKILYRQKLLKNYWNLENLMIFSNKILNSFKMFGMLKIFFLDKSFNKIFETYIESFFSNSFCFMKIKNLLFLKFLDTLVWT